MGPLGESSFRKRSCETPALLTRTSICRLSFSLAKCCLAAVRMVVTAVSASLRSACTAWVRMEWVVDRVVQRDSVRAREDSEVKLRRSEQPLEARLWAMASPMPA